MVTAEEYEVYDAGCRANLFNIEVSPSWATVWMEQAK